MYFGDGVVAIVAGLVASWAAGDSHPTGITKTATTTAATTTTATTTTTTTTTNTKL